MKDSDYILRNEPTSVKEVQQEIVFLNPGDCVFEPETLANFAELRSHLRKCERLLQLPSTHLCGADRYTVEMATEAPYNEQIRFVEKLYNARQREAQLRGEEWEVQP